MAYNYNFSLVALEIKYLLLTTINATMRNLEREIIF